MRRIWIYQANRFFTSPEQAEALAILEDFVADWTAHGNRLAAQVEIRYNLFVILQVDESVANVTGCSIDKSVHLLKDIERRLSISLFDRVSIAYRDEERKIEIVSRAIFEELRASGVVHDETIVFNNMLTSADDFPEKWEVPFSESWHAKVF